ncbi:hypothetical protein MTBBW1_1310103 [Desulfamplus magnetovallimortis]|uniref:Uncharacterized protein n=1 Tax=Desulfamplus magnetovallimortis TaxID=1246637 RepID=A0A1W1H7P5_9BACT|nr:hypothetical protein MTBBW1_1310103 [Desulfamplus magnetovallimortis]
MIQTIFFKSIKYFGHKTKDAKIFGILQNPSKVVDTFFEIIP